eukprot:TRINITY_DN6060_c0_g1_i3.p1 TRINITY_DN6060_c0_g1~~TRINITY_DN6060_c0_g1_i3.p1  ORF type:complete len:784 (+),score=106.34 TRINITY_DN6060_c0_g1_i3:180-2531(+)
MAAHAPQSTRIPESGRARFINNTPETWTLYVMQLEPQVLAPGDTWLTPRIGKPGMPVWVHAKCKCTSLSGQCAGRWMYNPLVGMGWSHELRYWAWRHGIKFEGEMPPPPRYYTGYFSIMEGCIVLEQLFKAGLKAQIVAAFVNSLTFFSGGGDGTPADGESWIARCVADPELEAQLPTLVGTLKMHPAIVSKVQDLFEQVFSVDEVLDTIAVLLLGGQNSDNCASTNDASATLRNRLMMSVMGIIQPEIAKDPTLQLLMFAMMDFVNLQESSKLSIFGNVAMKLPLRLLTPLLKRVARAAEPNVEQPEQMPLDITRLEKLGAELGASLLVALSSNDNKTLSDYKRVIPGLIQTYPALVVYIASSLLSEHALVVDEFMQLGSAMKLQSISLSLGHNVRSKNLTKIPKQLVKEFYNILQGLPLAGLREKHYSKVKQMDLLPPEWAIAVTQFLEFMDVCKSTTKWSNLKRGKPFATMYDMDYEFVRPVTRKTGCSLALLANQDSPLTSRIMLSHAWGEDAEECAEALEAYCHDNKLSFDTPVWFCVFSIYQPGSEQGDPGPTINEQVSLTPTPFQQVIRASSVKNGGGMVVLHTTTAEVYDRLWCVHEIDEALEQGVTVKPACSGRYSMVQSLIGVLMDRDIYEPGVVDLHFEVFTELAECSSLGDTLRIRKAVEAKEGGYKRLDSLITTFRRDMLKGSVEMWSMLDCGQDNISQILNAFELQGAGSAGLISREDLVDVLARLDPGIAARQVVEQTVPGGSLKIHLRSFLERLFNGTSTRHLSCII